MIDSKNSPLLIVALFAVAAAIAFHAWWPSFNADRDRERCIADCITRWQALGSNDEPVDPTAFELKCKPECQEPDCN